MAVEAVDEKDDENCLFLEWKLPFFQTHRHQLTKERRKFVRTWLETLQNISTFIVQQIPANTKLSHNMW